MMKGKLCICTDNTGLKDFAEDGDGILYFPSGDADALAERITYAVKAMAGAGYREKSGKGSL